MSARPIQPPLPGLVVSRGAFEYTLVDGGDNIHGVISARFGESPPISFVLRKNWESEVLSGCVRIKSLPAPQVGMKVWIQTASGLDAIYATVEQCGWDTVGSCLVVQREAGNTLRVRVSPDRWTPEFVVVTILPPIVTAPAEPTYQRYLKCAQAIWRMFDKDPLPDDDPAHSCLERLEALIRLRLIGPTPGVVPDPTSVATACPHGLILVDGTCSKCHAAIDPVSVAAARTKGAFQSAGPSPEAERCAEGHPTRWAQGHAPATAPSGTIGGAKTVLAELDKQIDAVEQSAIDANRRAGRNAKQRDEYNECLREALAMINAVDENSVRVAGWREHREALHARVRKAASDD